jgi:DNA-binding LytR/AlgR family response regulator
LLIALSSHAPNGTFSGMKTLIVDDEPIAREVLRGELEPFHDIVIVGEAENGRRALERIAEIQPDLVFLDLQMPVMGGLEVVGKLKGGHLPVIVIVTAYDEYAIEAFEAGAIDYLLKPVSAARLRTTVERARALNVRPRENAERVAEIASTSVIEAPSAPINRKIVAQRGEEYFLLDFDEVLAVIAEGELVWIVTARDRFLATQTLRTMEGRLQRVQFQRIHRNAIVNVNHVRKMSALSSQRWLLTLTNNQELIVSKRQAHTIRDLLR